MDNIFLNGDSLQYLLQQETQSIDCCLTDAPYGINADGGVNFRSNNETVKSKKYSNLWDSKTPEKIHFDEILRVCRKVFLFGGNFFTDKLPVAGHWIVWDKIGSMSGNPLSGDCELIWSNIPGKNFIKKYTVIQHGFIAVERERYHPTQKPVLSGELIMQDYLKPGERVLDCFAGSGSFGVSAINQNHPFIGIESDTHYFNIMLSRCRIAESKPRLYSTIVNQAEQMQIIP